jgi:ATP-dependent Lon protease
VAGRTDVSGVATGLAHTPSGGDIIFIEAASYPGKGQLILTGQIGDVMRESAQAAYSLVKSKADGLGIEAGAFASNDVHIHVPAGAIPKDGPSAGVAILTALTSLVTNKKVRADVAMTGEITLRGLVLPVGGVRVKVLAAKRAGIRRVLLPEDNRKDLAEIPKQVREGLEIIFCKSADDVMNAALDLEPGGRSKAKRPSRNRKSSKSAK